ncbi:MAG: hypothetical protein R8M11_09415 [Gallionella sp.]
MAETVTREQIRQMNQQVEGIKSEILDIANSMIQLDERLIFPEKSRISLFITFTEGDEVSLEKLSVKIDGKEAVIHTYTPSELNALQHGGAQRIYTGNVSGGMHLLEVAAIDSSDEGAAHSFEEFRFEKSMNPKVIEISISGKTFGDHAVDFKE